jgi:cation-transporting P-type ATPase I
VYKLGGIPVQKNGELSFASILEGILDVVGPRKRRAWIGRNRAHIEFRELSQDEIARLRSRIEESTTRLDRMRSVEVNAHTRRVVIAFDDHAYSLTQLIPLVEEAERLARVDTARFCEEAAEHPADVEPAKRLMLELATDVVGLAIGTSLRLSPFRASNLAASAAAISTIVRSSPRLRRGLDERLGPRRADIAMNAAIAMSQGLAQRPVSSLVDVAHKLSLLRETRWRSRIWEQRETELCGEPCAAQSLDSQVEPRPVPLPRGPIEEYADRAWIVSLGGFAVSFLSTRSIQQAVAALFGALPKPARLGRDVFAADLGRVLAKRGVLVLDDQVLRRLDRIDCMVIQGDLVARDRFVVGEVIALGLHAATARQCAAELFDADRPVEIRRRAGWTLGPPSVLDASLDSELATRAGELARRGALVLGLAREGRVVAIIELKVIAQTGVDELIAAAHEAQMRVVVTSDDESILQGLPADDTIPELEGLESGIRRLQREGRAVMLVATGKSRGLAAADCTLGLIRGGEPSPWGAHLICGEDLSDVRFVLQACVTARQIAKQSVNVALGAATVGTLVSAGGVVPMTTRRVIAVVNTACLIAMGNGVRCSRTLERRALPPPRDRTPWHALDAHGVMVRLGVSTGGLGRAEVTLRGGSHGADKSVVTELGEAITDELFNPLAPLLAAGAGLSAVVGSLADATMVGGVVVLNATIGGVQRFRAERAIRDLAKTSRRRALVRRAGELREIDDSALVRGDIVLLAAGDVVPADLRIIESESLEVDASSLTGESLPVKKSAAPSYEAQIADRSSMLYEGTSIASGRATAVVVATGDETEARRASAASARDPLTSGVERRLRSLINMTAPVALTAGAGLIGAGLLRGRKLEDVIGSGVSLAVASVPEGLPLLATAAQLAAAQRLSRRGALVRNARSIEALGRVDLLCVDKTGTLTEGRIELGCVADGDAEESLMDVSGPRLRVLAAALRATPDPRMPGGQFDPTDAALVRAAEKIAIRGSYGSEDWRPVSELPFEAGRGYHAVVGTTGGGFLLSVKGAPEAILPNCSRRWLNGERVPLDQKTIDELTAAASRMARRGLRVLAIAERSVAADDSLDPSRLVGLAFRGLIGFSDPVRPEAAAALEQLRRTGVEVVMMTGDHPSTAEAIAAELDIARGKSVLTGADLSRLSEEELDQRVAQVSVFARLTPSQKVRVVRALQRRGRVVAMVGDGANDAPAIRLANVGIAIGERSTSAARGAADIVLTDERIETLVEAIVEGRAMWASVRDAVSILVGGNLGEIAFTLAGGLVDGRPPLNARQLLLVNLLTDVAPAMAIALRPPAADVKESLAREGPDASLGHALDRDIASRAVVTAGGAGAAWAVGRFTGTRERASTIGLIALVGTQLGQTLLSGGLSRPVILTGVLSVAALAGIVQSPGLSHFFGCRPLGPLGWATAATASVTATGLAAIYPEAVAQLAQRLRLVGVMSSNDPDALPAGPVVAARLPLSKSD